MKRRRYIRVVNYEELQYHKRDNPPWIRLYRKLLDNADFCELPDSQKYHLIGLWLLASKHNNRIFNDLEWIQSHISATTDVDLERLLRAKFVRRCRKTVTSTSPAPVTETTPQRQRQRQRQSKSKTPVSRKPRKLTRPEYTERFLYAWDRYPHYGQRSVKSESFRVWCELGLDGDKAFEGVGVWVVAGLAGPEWTEKEGKFVKGFQSWLRHTDFLETPPSKNS